MKRIFGLIPNVFFLGLVSLFNDFSGEMVMAVMPVFLLSLGAAPLFIGFLEGFANALASALKIISGWFSDKIRRRKIISVGGYTLSLLTRWFLYFVGNVWQVFSLRAIDRVGKGLRDSPRDALLAESVSASELGKSFGYQRAMDAMGGVLGPLAAVALIPLIGGNYRTLFFIASLVGILAIFSFVFVKEPKQISPSSLPPSPSIPPFTFSLVNFDRSFKLFLAAVFCFGLGMMPISVMLLKTGDVGSVGTLIPVMYLIYNISFALFAIPFGKLSDKITERRVILGGFTMAIISYFILASASSIFTIGLGFVVFGFYSAMTNGVQKAYASKLVSSLLQASGQGFLGAATGLSSLLAGLVGGGIWTWYGAHAAFIYGIVMMAMGFVIFLRLNGAERTVYNN